MANYLTFASAEPFTIAVYDTTKYWDGILEYSTDTASWNEWDGTTAIASAEHGGEHRIYVRGSGNSVIAGASGLTKRKWVLTGANIRCIGNIENLLDYKTVANGEHPVMANNCFRHMFEKCDSLIHPPELPATALVQNCYSYMFHGCSKLTQAPKLPATTLAECCYYGMFMGCYLLAQLPELPATTLPEECYEYMFAQCYSLKLSETQTDEYTTAYRIPSSGIGTEAGATHLMFTQTGGTFTGTPNINTTYYTANKVIPATKPVTPKLDPTELLMGWQVGNRIRQRGNIPQISITFDDQGNASITGSIIIDDGEGNVTITSSGSVSITDDGYGNVVIAQRR